MKIWMIAAAVGTMLICCQGTLADTVAYWRFEEGVADTVASGANSILDSSGNNLHGTPSGSPVYRSVPIPGSTLGLEFQPTTDGVDVPDNPLFAITGSLTLEAYIRLDSFPANDANLSQIIFRGDDRAGFDPYYLAVLSDGRLSFLVTESSGVGSAVISPEPLPLDTFLHVAGTLDDATGLQKVYVNKMEANSLTTGIRPFAVLDGGFNPGVGVGNLQGGVLLTQQVFPGIIDEARISNIALPPDQFVPEPSGMILCGIGLMCLGLYARMRRQRHR